MKKNCYLVLITFLCLFFTGCNLGNPNQKDTNKDPSVKTIAFGSCSKPQLDQPLWSEILKNNPDIWTWLGDIVYADQENAPSLRALYNAQLDHPDYTQLRNESKVIGIWDDHDYGINDGGKYYKEKLESKMELLRFLQVPDSAAVYHREGAYQAFNFGPAGQRVKIILLDSRYFRDDPVKDENGYAPQLNGSILGEKQWQWLEEQIEDKSIDLFVIGNGIQVIPKEHRFEKWNNFPKERQRLFDLINRSPSKNFILISGDRHIGEISKISIPTKTIFEVTSSGLTHSYSSFTNEPNQYRVSDVVSSLNFGLIQIDWTNRVILAQLRGVNNTLFESVEIALK
ncbi:MAG: alkaline phosphatase family protein [Cyclobacteriaceae bacterium]|nr:alkaline phosphatase family protein [Cyclobacteriaceae bacterium HetDA_MAG_MS6]